jgi:hypothetical protein
LRRAIFDLRKEFGEDDPQRALFGAILRCVDNPGRDARDRLEHLHV